MKKRILPLVLSGACLLLLFLQAPAGKPVVNISKIQIQTGLLTAKLVMEADGPLSVENVFYSPDAKKTLIMDVMGAQALQAPIIPTAEAGFIRDIQIQKSGETDVRFFIELSERVPCRLVSDAGRTILEFAKIPKIEGAYPMDAETQSRLESSPRSQIVLQKLDYNQTAEAVSFKADLTGQAVTQVFALENPPRLVVDLFDTLLSARADVRPALNASSPVQRLRVAQFQNEDPAITRLVFDLKESGLYSLDSQGDGLVVSFFTPNTASKTEKAEPEVNATKIEPPPPMPAVKTPEPELKSESKSVEISNPPSITEVKADPAPKVVESSPQEKRAALIPEKKTIAGEEAGYSGEILSIRVKDADLRDVVLYLADFAGLNVTFDPEVRGIVTLNLQDVPWDQILDVVLRQNKMGKTIEGNILRIAPINVLIREEEDQRKLRESRELAGPVLVKTFTLSYSKAKDVMTLLRSKLSTQGEMIVDERTNTLLITEVKDKLDLIEKLIAVVDTPTPQVSIEARIVEATATFIRNLGIQWGFKGISDPFYGNATSVSFPNKVLIDGAQIPTGIVTKGIGGPLGGYAINLPAPAFNTAVGFSFANVLDTFRLDVALSALETAGEGKIISLPKVTTQNNQQAEIIQGRQIPVQTVANFTVTTRYVNAALELRATPQITAEGTIIMTVEIQNNAADFANLVNGIPPITTQSAKTTVMVPDGGTTVIGGIYRTEDSVTRERVPFLHQIPILGNMFKNFARTKQQRELLIFITPRIVR